jgi:hypothetical protein
MAFGIKYTLQEPTTTWGFIHTDPDQNLWLARSFTSAGYTLIIAGVIAAACCYFFTLHRLPRSSSTA